MQDTVETRKILKEGDILRDGTRMTDPSLQLALHACELLREHPAARRKRAAHQ
jgi:hypothetical protein